ncbi:hypothetical protein [Actinophytocola sp.]|uniref:hypothetical protein n=1 Tax=Actinophytocola sp. TaxID=1872138 RepID=UPI00389A1CCC
MRRLELPEQWERVPELRQRVEDLLKSGRRRTALDEVLRHLRHDPESTDALVLALTFLGQSRTETLESVEPMPDVQRWCALLAPIMTECTACHVAWYSNHVLLRHGGITDMAMANPVGLQCQDCRYTLCRDCLARGRAQSHAVPVDMVEFADQPCPASGCNGTLTTPVFPTGCHDVTPMDPNEIEGVIVARDGLIPPTMDEALVPVTKFLPLIADDAPLIHIRRSIPGLMSDESTREELARSLVLEMEREMAITSAAWARSERMFIRAGTANDTDYLIIVVRKDEHHPSPRRGTRVLTYTYLVQVLPRRGTWGTLRDPHSGDFREGTFGAVAVPEGTLADIAQKIIGQSTMDLKHRVLFFEGDRTKDEKLSFADVYGVVTQGSDIVSPYSDDSA